MKVNYIEANFDDLMNHLDTIPEAINKIAYIKKTISQYEAAKEITIEKIGKEMYDVLEPAITDPDFIEKCNNLIKEIERNRFNLVKSEQNDYYICTDTHYLVVCKFKHKKFNDTQKIEIITDIAPDAILISRILREMADWLYKYHYNKII